MRTHAVRIPDDLQAEIKSFADQEERSVTWMVRRLLREALAARGGSRAREVDGREELLPRPATLDRTEVVKEMSTEDQNPVEGGAGGDPGAGPEAAQKPAKKRKPRRYDYSEDFEFAWALYGRRGDKSDSYVQWLAALERLDHPDAVALICVAAEQYVKATPDVTYRKHFERWLKADGWESVVVADEKKTPKGQPTRDQGGHERHQQIVAKMTPEERARYGVDSTPPEVPAS